MKILELIAQRLPEKYALHDQYLNGQIVKVLKTIGYDVAYTEARGPYLFDAQGNRYLDLLSGWGVFALGRNHPKVIEVLSDVLHGGLPHLVQMDVTVLAGLLAERLVAKLPPGLEKVFFCNSGAESVEAAMKFARYATKRSKIVYVERGYHGLTYGPLSINGMEEFRDGFGPLLPDCVRIPFDDLAALENALRGRDVAAFVVEPIIGHGVHIPHDDYLPGAQALCRKYGTLLVCDEVQTGLGRTGKFLAVEHWGVEPDMICLAKALSAGFVPVGAVACRRSVFDAVFNRMDRAVVHGSTYSKNNLAMAAGLALLEVLDEEKLVENAASLGQQIIDDLKPLVPRYEFLKDVRGKGMMIALEFGKPDSFKLKTAWRLLETANDSLFGQLITVPLFTKHRILSQIAGHHMHVVKFLPPLNIGQEDREWIVRACESTIADAHQVGGAVWDLGKQLAGAAIRMKTGG
ncbi:MAG: aspartate aminotransferase family protein [Proteobacteria bacterium]|nr:MAG: aspartate aminotransferase family protein [Pseudomonadota bacterium]